MTQQPNSIYSLDTEDESRVLNVLQTLAIGVVMMLGVAFVAKSLGLSWSATLLVGWMGGLAATLVAIFGVYIWSEREAGHGAALAPEELDVLIGAWDDDLANDAQCAITVETDVRLAA
jgi:hypothetical protein